MAEPTTPKMNPNPNATAFVFKNIDVVVARADSPKLILCQFLKITSSIDPPIILHVKEVVLNLDLILATDAEADVLPYLVHDVGDVGLNTRNVLGLDCETHGLVSATDVVADAGR